MRARVRAIGFSRRTTASFFVAVVAMLAAAAVPAVPALAVEVAPALSVTSRATPTYFKAGDAASFTAGGEEHKYSYDLRVANLGAEATDASQVTITDTLPVGIEVVGSPEFQWRILKAGAPYPEGVDFAPSLCAEQTAALVTTVSCTVPSSLPGDEEAPSRIQPSEEMRIAIPVRAPGSAQEGEILTNHVEVQRGAAPAASATSENRVASLDLEGNPLSPPAGLSYYEAALLGADGQPASQAGSHPYQLTVNYAVNTKPGPSTGTAATQPAGGDLKDVRVSLPAGVIGSATAVPQCTPQEFTTIIDERRAGAEYSRPGCPDDSAVGLVTLKDAEGVTLALPTPLYNLVPPPGMAAQFGFTYTNLPFYIDTEVRSGSDYGIDSVLHNQSQVKRVAAASVTVWGTPGDPRHDPLRGACLNNNSPQLPLSFGNCPAGVAPKPLLRLPTSCATPLAIPLTINNWTAPDQYFSETDSHPAPSGCNQLDFEPTLEARPTTKAAGSPSGLHVDVHVPQNEDPEDLGTSDLKDTVVTLPRGISISPSSANGLEACSPEDIGLKSAPGNRPVEFAPGPSACPKGAQIGTAEVDTPLLDHPLKGGVYIATPHENPFGSLLAIYVAINDSQTGINLKLAGKVEADPVTGQLTTTFDETPQQPFEDFKLDFFGGAAAALANPQSCGTFTTSSGLTPWSAPSVPEVTSSSSFEIDEGCGARGFAPSFSAGTTSNQAGVYSPLSVTLSRSDQDQDLQGIKVQTPPGVLGMLSSVPLCGEAQANAGTCSSASQIGYTTVAAGPGPSPVYLPIAGQPANPVYLTTGYKGAPFGLSVVVPAIAGPYNLGTVVLRAAIDVDPHSSQVTITSDPLPQILQGIPLQVRNVNVTIDRPGFMFNPTNCEALSINGTITSAQGASAAVSNPFKAAGCAKLAFKPAFAASTQGNGSLNHKIGASLTVKIASKQGPSSSPEAAKEANIAKVDVSLPVALPSRLTTLQKACTAGQFAANPAGCPAASDVGTAVAHTPVLPVPLAGPAYLVSHGGAAFPDLDLVLQGDGVTIDLVGSTQIKKGITYSRFETVPDAPISSFELKLPEGPFSALAATKNLCALTRSVTVSKKASKRVNGHLKHVTVKVKKSVPEPLLMPTEITAQNGAVLKQQTKVAVTGCPKPKPKPAKKKGKKKEGKNKRKGR